MKPHIHMQSKDGKIKRILWRQQTECNDQWHARIVAERAELEHRAEQLR